MSDSGPSDHRAAGAGPTLGSAPQQIRSSAAVGESFAFVGGKMPQGFTALLEVHSICDCRLRIRLKTKVDLSFVDGTTWQNLKWRSYSIFPTSSAGK